MNIEDRIREIVREELAKAQYAKPAVPRYEPRNWEDVRVGMMEKCPTCGRKDFLTCANTHCFMRPPVVRYGAAPVYNPPGSGLVELCDSVATERETRIADHIKAVLTPAAGVFGDVVNDAVLNNRGSFTIKANGAVEYIAPADFNRTGCACPPGTVASCPDKACPWKP